MGRSFRLVALGAVLGLLGALGLAPRGIDRVEAQQKPSVQTVYRADLANIPGQETIFEILTIPPGLATPRHLHPDGHEIVYVLEGATSGEINGEETRVYNVGEVVHVAPNIPHVGRNASATQPLKVLIVRIKDKSKPLTVPVP